MQKWHEEAGMNGFILSYVADWWSPRKIIFENYKVLTEINKKGIHYGLDSNFIKVALGYRELPNWTDDLVWEDILDNFRDIAELIKTTGTKGIAIDTEPYKIPLFDSKAKRFKNINKELLKTAIYKRGRQIMQSITEVFPEIEVIILPEGAFYWFNQNQGQHPSYYELWIDFFNGMVSVKNKKGIILASERTYSVLNKNYLNTIYDLINKTMLEHIEDPVFWKMNCSIAIGMWPLGGKTYSDKSARYSSVDFKRQFIHAKALCTKYVWIYGNGADWWQMNYKELKKYTVKGRKIWGKEYQTIPTDPAIMEYYSVVKEN
ncbi:MAG: hypothetical protein MRK02_18070 [Candidatus Scalindua sp.]|nr:hypothetical protein [Candidatus Scalindua sp.]